MERKYLTSRIWTAIASVLLIQLFPEPVLAKTLEWSKAPHEVQLLDTGASSLDKIVKIIHEAKESVDLEYFAFNFCSKSGNAVLQALYAKIAEAKAAGKPFRVRLLLDHHDLAAYNPDVPLISLTKALQANGIELKFFNAGLAYDVVTHLTDNQRDHRKMTIADSSRVVLGGRNLSDDYFGLQEGMNRIDKDIWVDGPIVKPISASFDELWNSDDVRDLSQVINEWEWEKDSNAQKTNRWKELQQCISPRPEDRQFLSKLSTAAAKHAEQVPRMTVQEIAVGLDRPGCLLDKSESFVAEYYESIGNAEKRVFLENQYFVPDGLAREALAQLKEKRVPVTVVTNSYLSQDDKEVGLLTHRRAQRQKESSVRVRGFRGKHPIRDGVEWFDKAKGSRWQLHAKSAVIDDKTSWVGSNNIDPRSDYSNLEIAVMIPNDPRFAGIMMDSIGANMSDSYDLTDDPHYIDCYRKSSEYLEDFFDRLIPEILSRFY